MEVVLGCTVALGSVWLQAIQGPRSWFSLHVCAGGWRQAGQVVEEALAAAGRCGVLLLPLPLPHASQYILSQPQFPQA